MKRRISHKKSWLLNTLIAMVALCNTSYSDTTDWIAYNDCVGTTAANANTTNYTTYSGYTGATTGLLKNDSTGSTAGMPTVTFTMPTTPQQQPLTAMYTGVNPNSGTTAYSIFNGKVDFSGTIIQHSSSTGWSVDITFTNLDPAKKYSFVASSFRNSDYTDRNTKHTIIGADEYTNNSSVPLTNAAGVIEKNGSYTVFRAANNREEGHVIRWDNIKCGSDGSFSINTVSVATNGRYGYPIHGFMLMQVSNPTNQAPAVNAGVDQTINYPRQYVTLGGTATDYDRWGEPMGFLSTTWSQDSGPSTVQFANTNSLTSSAYFPTAGTYQLKLTASDGLLTSTDAMTVTVAQPIRPIGDIDGDYKVMLNDLKLLATDWLISDATPAADLDGDNIVNILDFRHLSQSWMENWTGSVQVNITPASLVEAGAKWRVDGGTWQDSGAIVSDLTEGTHTIDYSAVALWATPASQTFTITRQQTSQVTGTYADLPKSVRINEFMAVNSSIPYINSLNVYTRYPWNTNTTGDVNPDWIELHNYGTETVNLAGWYMTDDKKNLTKWQFPANMGSALQIAPGGYLIIFASSKDQQTFPTNYPFIDAFGSLHTNFELSASGDYLATVYADGMTVINEYKYPKQLPFISYGIAGNGSIGYLTTPTPGTMTSNKWPGATNVATSLPGIVSDTKFSHPRGFYDTAFNVTITSETADAEIHYTLDGTEPQATVGGYTQLYTGPITISKTTCLRAKAFKNGLLPSNIDTQTYIFLNDIVNQTTPTDTRYSTSWGGYPSDYEMENNATDLALVVGDSTYTTQQAQDTIKTALTSLPVISVVADPDGLFGSTNGIYTNSLNSGDLWERPVSAEYFNDPKESFQIDCGLNLQGDASRYPEKECKHSFSLRFRGGYGNSALKSSIFEPQTEIGVYDALQLRASFNNSWRHWLESQRLKGDLIRDQFARDCMVAVGDESGGSGKYVHLFINGMYWGIYNLHERPEASHYANYFGGDSDFYDALNGSSLADGDSDSWNSLTTLINNSSATSQSDWETICARLDVQNCIDWTIMQVWGYNHDLQTAKNWKAAGGGVFNAPWRFYLWDTERTLEEPTVGDASASVFASPYFAGTLSKFTEFKMMFADRLYKHFNNNGVLSYNTAWSIYSARVTEIQNAIVAESARWGDFRRDVATVNKSTVLYTKKDHWDPEIARINTYLQAKPANSIAFFKTKSLYPTIEPPLISINGTANEGGYVTFPCTLTLTNNNGVGVIYYTLDGTDPRQYWTGNINNTAMPNYNTPVTLTKAATVKCRILNGTTWSAIHEATFADLTAKNSLRITEVMYNPTNPENEFIEIKNISASAVNLNLVKFTKGINHIFGDTNIAAGGYLLLVKNLVSFNAAYPSIPAGVDVVQWADGSLDNTGDKIKFNDAVGQTIHSFDYKDGWYPLTDGEGFSLTVINPMADIALWDDKTNWRASTSAGGSPGSEEIGLTPDTIVINELLAHSHDIAPDWIELYNTSSQPVSIGGWFLSDDSALLTKYEIPDNTVVPAYGFVVLYENLTFGEAFALSENGETLYLTSGSGGAITGYQVNQSFDPSQRNISHGRFVTSTGNIDFVAMSSQTPGNANSYPLVGPVIISEIQYNPASNNTGDEFIELHNITNQPVMLESLADTETAPGVFSEISVPWSFDQGIDFTFASGTTIPAGGYLIVAKNKTAFLAYYTSLPVGTQVVGPFANSTSLSNGGEKIRLCMPGEQAYGGERNWIRVDQVSYDDEGGWPTTPDGGGQTLNRINLSEYGNDLANWTGATPNPGM